MAAIRHRDQGLAIGVDVGGTWLRLAASRGRRPLGAEARVRADRDLGSLPRVLARLWRRRGWRRGDVAALVVASRAIWTTRECRALARALSGLARRVHVLPDAQAALLGALGDEPGVLVLSGTGSIVVGHGRGRWARAGGLGPLLGDEGSGFWLGREWLAARGARGDLPGVLRIVHAPDAVARIAALAPRLLARARQGHRPARAIVRRGQMRLAAHARAIARGLELRAPVRVSWAGSVMADPWFRAGVVRALARSRTAARWSRPAAEPVAAALRIAERLAGGRRGGRPARG